MVPSARALGALAAAVLAASFYHPRPTESPMAHASSTRWSSLPADAPWEARCEALLELKGAIPEAERLHLLFDAHWAALMDDQPTMATYVGWPTGQDRWPDVSLAADARRQAEDRCTQGLTASFDRDALSEEDRLNLELFAWDIQDRVAGADLPQNLMPLSQVSGVHQDIVNTLASMPAQTASDYQAILARLHRAPTYVDQTIAVLEEGLRRGITPPRIILRDIPGQVAALLDPAVDRSPLLEAFREMPPGIPPADAARLVEEARAAVRDEIQPALARLRAFLEERYVPGARTSLGLSELPDGPRAYAWAVRHHTTTDLTPDEIHAIGLTEVERIRARMDEVIQEVGFTGSFQDFISFLRTDPRFYYTEPEALLTGYRDICKRIDPGLIRLFGHLPRLPYGVKAIPDYSAPSQTTAYYYQGSIAAGRPGWYYANTWDLKSRPKWEMEALSVHEAVPGHHLQISIAQEMEGVPTFRQQLGTTAYVEGWALYAEDLGYDLGLYTDPYSRFGQLTYEMWRAIRLVVDTGIHAKGWTRDQAIAWFMARTSKPEHDVVVEVDRYIAWPGQALAYKIGQLHIRALRQRAETALGPRFDLRAFHDALLGSGAMPLDLLSRHMDAWIADQETAR